MSYRLGVDVGGTFTDLLLFKEGKQQFALAKVPSTPANQAVGIIDGLKKISQQSGIRPDEILLFLHGTTVATNAILEGKVAKTAVIVTKGFRDVLHIMRQDRPRLYDFFTHRPEPLVPRHLRFEVSERILHSGEVQITLNEKELKRIIRKIRSHQVEAVAVCLLHSYANAIHEQRVKQILSEQCPEISVSISSDVLPEIKEYERMSTTTMNACVVPIVDKYLNELKKRLAQVSMRRTVHVMQSNGGIMSSSAAGQKSIGTILSGPAAGVLGGVALAKLAGFPNVITLDMGGTSFDICLSHQGKLKLTHESELGGHALRVPMIDIHSIGAGGGSIAWLDTGGVLKTGPQSAGADPGPVCYGKGGLEPTVTDANLVLNRLNPDFFLGGEMKVDRDAAYKVIEKKLAKPLGLGVLEVAEGIIRVVNASMVRGMRFVSVEKGYDPREFTLVCFGGNGPLHAVELAEELGAPEVVIPFAPGVNCAYGLLMADLRQDYVKTHLKKLSEVRLSQLNAGYRTLENNARAAMRRDDVPISDLVINRAVDIRYDGQGYGLEVPVASRKITKTELRNIENRFHALHKKLYGFSRSGEPTEIVNLRIICSGIMPKPKLRKERLGSNSPNSAPKETRQVYLKGKYRKTPIYSRESLNPGAVVKGPAVIEQKDSTTLVFHGNSARVDAYRNIIISTRNKE